LRGRYVGAALGLTGFLGVLPGGGGRGGPDKFHLRFDELAGRLMEKGYSFVRVDSLLAR
jgi:hypothetical protein